MFNKVCEKHVNNRLLDDLEACGLFSGFLYGFRSSQSTADHLTVVADRIARTFNSFGVSQALALDISRLLGGCDMLVFLTNLSVLECRVIN